MGGKKSHTVFVRIYLMSRERAQNTVKYMNEIFGGKHTENMEIVLL
jgi:hypothetical protein